MDYVPILFISAKRSARGAGVPLVSKCRRARGAGATLPNLNRVLRDAQDLHAPTSRTGVILKIYNGTQGRRSTQVCCR